MSVDEGGPGPAPERRRAGLVALCFMWLVVGVYLFVVVVNGSQLVTRWG